MANPSNSITVFSFYCDSFEQLPIKMEAEVGYRVKPSDIWSINIKEVNNKLHVVLTIIYWKPAKIAEEKQIERINEILNS